MSDRGILSSLRYLLADFIGEDDDTPPLLPEGLPEPVMAVASDAIHLLIDYQGTAYAQLYVDRLRRFVGKNGVDDAMLTEIARLIGEEVLIRDRETGIHRPVRAGDFAILFRTREIHREY